MKWFGRERQYISLVIQENLTLFLLQKKDVRLSIISSESIDLAYAGIVDGCLGNPSFFIDVLNRFFEKNTITNPSIMLILTQDDPAVVFQYELYFEYFKMPLEHVVIKTTNKTIESCAINVWQGE